MSDRDKETRPLDLHDDAAYLNLGRFVNWRVHFPALFEGHAGGVEAMAQALLEHIGELDNKGHTREGTPSLAQTRLMALEIVTHYQRKGAAMPLIVERLLAAALGFDPSGMPDPRDYYVPARERPKEPLKRSQAEWHEAEHLAKNGRWASVISVAQNVGVSRATVRDQWRTDPDYIQAVQFFADQMSHQ